jgi:hypothetical protein
MEQGITGTIGDLVRGALQRSGVSSCTATCAVVAATRKRASAQALGREHACGLPEFPFEGCRDQSRAGT